MILSSFLIFYILFLFCCVFWLVVGCWFVLLALLDLSLSASLGKECVHIRLYILFCPSTPVELILLLVSASVDITTYYTRYIPAYIITYIPTSLGREGLAQQ